MRLGSFNFHTIHAGLRVKRNVLLSFSVVDLATISIP